MVKTADGKIFDPSEARLVGSVKTARARDINDAAIGQFPVFVEQHGSYRMFTYNKKLIEI